MRRAVQCSALSLILAYSPCALGAEVGRADRIPLACATRDLQILTLIEEHGERGDVSSERLTMAAFAMQIAREACSAGRTEIAMAIYDLIHPEVILVALNR